MSVVGRFPTDGPRELFEEAVGATDPQLLEELRATDEPRAEQRQRVGVALSDCFEWVGEDYEPSPRTIRLEQLLNAFYLLYPLQRLRPERDDSGTPTTEPGDP